MCAAHTAAGTGHGTRSEDSAADVPANRYESDGASACPPLLSPQQVTVLSVRNPHECQPPADTAVNEPDGPSVCPSVLRPQQVTEPSLRTPACRST